MGIDLDLFLNPDRIPSSLICPICTLVVENPVMTPSEHLFCESCLLEWLVRSNLCPVTHSEIAPENIKKPGRLIVNILAELRRICPNKCCTWTGCSDEYPRHATCCQFRPREEIMQELDDANEKVGHLTIQIRDLHIRCQSLEEENLELRQEVTVTKRKLRVYDAFFQKEEEASSSSCDNNHGRLSSGNSRSSDSKRRWENNTYRERDRDSPSKDFMLEPSDETDDVSYDYSLSPGTMADLRFELSATSPSGESRSFRSEESVAIRLARLRDLKSFVGNK